ncbi:MAG: hypothetical protein M3R24_39730 [Chloroflexota bacterium]|nr:hypothetical protein [Chloroflexota bacterium]
MTNEANDVRRALARVVAQRGVEDVVIDQVANQIAVVKYPIRGIDVCERGICIDYILESGDWRQTLPDLIDVQGARLRGIEVFPWGIINPDILHVRVTQEFDVMPRMLG